MDARHLLHGLAPAQVAELAQVSTHTARRWLRRGRVPPMAYRLLELLIVGELGVIARAWRGWALRAGELITPEGWPVRPGEVRAIPYRLQQLRELERALAEPCQWSLFVSRETNIESYVLRPRRASDAGAGERAAAGESAPPGRRARRAQSRSTA